MTTDEVRDKYIKFFSGAPRNHKEISPASLILEGDSTTLFTSAGMQQLIPYLKGEAHPMGKRLVDSQPSIRTQDIEEVGDNRHTTFFEMLGNWSLGDYFKSEQIPWIWEFLTKELGLPEERLWVAVFEGNDSVPKDEESYKAWKKLGVPDERIHFYGVDKSWWSRSGPPDKMPPGEIGGPDSEVFFEFTNVKHDPKFGEKCHPNCDCGRFLEIGNSVFIQYEKQEDGSLKELPQKNVDFGGGLERLVAATNDDPDVFKTDAFKTLIDCLPGTYMGDANKESSKNYRIVVDHLKASVLLISSGVLPSNKQQGYVLRRLIRRAIIKMKRMNIDDWYIFEDEMSMENTLYGGIATAVARLYQKTEFGNINVSDATEVLNEEALRFSKTLDKGLKEVGKIEKIDGKKAFDLYQTYGFPLEITEEIFEEKGQKIDSEEFKKEFEKHQELSRTASAGKFKGGLADHSEETTQLHTVTHLLHAALRKVLGDHVGQKGSNITVERLRFDFSHPEKLTDEEIKKVEDLVNEQIAKKLPVSMEVMTLDKAKKAGALAFFGNKYDEKVKVYIIGDPTGGGQVFSREVCGGPHVNNLSEIAGHVRITKQESASAGVRRVYAVVEKN